jgi:hypothetical protein
MNTHFQLKVDGFTQIFDASEITELADMYRDSGSISYAAVACNSPDLLTQVSERLIKEANVTVQGILTVSPDDVNEDLITQVSIKGIHIDFGLCNGEEDLKNIGMLALKCSKLNIITYISNMEWSTFETLLDDYQSDCTFVYILPSANLQATLKSLQERVANDMERIKAGVIPPLFSVIGMYDVHTNEASMEWLSQNIPLLLETTGVGSIRPIELSSTTSQLFLLESHDTANNLNTSIMGAQYVTFLLKQIIKRTNWTSG